MSAIGLAQARRVSGQLALVAPLLVTLVAALLAWVLDEYTLTTVALWAIYGLLALSLDLVWGRAGIFSFGQTAFFGLAGYTYGAIAINMAGVTGESGTAILGGVLAGTLLATLLGYFMIYGRVSDVYLAIITLAVTLVLYSFFASTAGSQYAIGSAELGGYNGMISIPPITLGLPGLGPLPLDVRGTYLGVVLAAGAVYVLLVALLRAPFGRILVAIRENELRTELLGYDTRWYKLLAFALGGAIAGLAGSCFAAWGLFINPAVFNLQQAVAVVIWVLVGGRGTLAGAFLGAALIEGLSTWLGGISPSMPLLGGLNGQTPLVLGLLLIVLVLLIPNGLLPLAAALWGRLWPQPRPAPLAAQRVAPQGPTSGPQPPAGEPPGTGEAILETRELSIAFDGLKAVDAITIGFGPGLHCVIGPNGAGKSTFFNLLVGRYRPLAGTILYRGRDISRLEAHQRARSGIGIKLQVASIYLQLSVEENAWLAAYAHVRQPDRAAERGAAALAQVGLLSRAGEIAGHLSHGERQWLEMAMVLASDPALILLDEPTAGMTRDETARTARLIGTLAQRATVLVVEHDMEFVRQLQAPVTVMHQGQIFKRGTLEEIQQDEAVLDIYLGRRAGAAG